MKENLLKNLTYIKNNCEMLQEISENRSSGRLVHHQEGCDKGYEYEGKCKCSKSHRIKIYEQSLNDNVITLHEVLKFVEEAIKLCEGIQS